MNSAKGSGIEYRNAGIDFPGFLPDKRKDSLRVAWCAYKECQVQIRAIHLAKGHIEVRQRSFAEVMVLAVRGNTHHGN